MPQKYEVAGDLSITNIPEVLAPMAISRHFHLAIECRAHVRAVML